MRETFDRLVGPILVVRREPHRSTALLGSTATVALAPVKLGRWKVVRGTRPTPALFQAIADCAVPDDDGIARAASRHGLCVSSQAVDRERAAQLLAGVREKRASQGESPLHDPLIVYQEGEDPRPMWRLHLQPKDLQRDACDDLADAIAWCFRVFGARPEFGEWDRRSEIVAKGWQAEDGVAKLYRSTVAEIHRATQLDQAGWLPIFGLAILRASTKVKDRRLLWQALVVASPLLLVMAESEGSQPPSDVHVELLVDKVSGWRRFAREAAAWRAVIEELPKLDEDIRRSRASRNAGPPSTLEIKAAVEQLRSVLLATDLRLRLHDLEATDTDGIRAALQKLLSERLASAGIDSDTPGGTLASVEATTLLSIRAALAQRVCKVCGRRAARGPRCAVHERAFSRDRKRQQRLKAAKRKKRTSTT